MRRNKTALIPLIAILGMAALGTTSALAEEAPTFEPLFWKVNGTKLEAGKEKAFSGESTGTYVLKGEPGGVKTTVECKKVKVKGTIKGGIPATAEATDEFGECSSKQCKSVSVTPPGPNLAWYGALWIGVETWSVEVYILGPPGKNLVAVSCEGKKFELEGTWAAEILNEAGERIDLGKEVEQTKELLRTPVYEKFNEWIWNTSSKSWEGGFAELKLGGKAGGVEDSISMKLTSGEKFGLFS